MDTAIHLCIASGQHQPNVLPVLHFRPARVVVLASEAMSRQGERLCAIIGEFTQGAVVTELIREFPDSEPAAIACAIEALLARLRREVPGASLVFNATGGTKQMAIAITDCLNRDVTVFYCDTPRERISWLRPVGREATPLPSLLDLPKVAACMDRCVVDAQSSRPDLISRLEQRADTAAGLFGLAATSGETAGFGLANKAVLPALTPDGRSLRQPQQALAAMLPRNFSRLLEPFLRGGLLRLYQKQIEFLDVETTRFLGGGWLEEHLYRCARECGFDEVHLGVTLKVLQGEARNEIDVLVVHRNRVLLIECKTISKDAAKKQGGELIYKLDSVGSAIGGLLATRWLVSLNPLGQHGPRARRAGITVTSGARLAQVADALKVWQATGRLPSEIDDHAPATAQDLVARHPRR